MVPKSLRLLCERKNRNARVHQLVCHLNAPMCSVPAVVPALDQILAVLIARSLGPWSSAPERNGLSERWNSHHIDELIPTIAQRQTATLPRMTDIVPRRAPSTARWRRRVEPLAPKEYAIHHSVTGNANIESRRLF
jgi:hypothetical protein